jgi:hypothetical protein
VHDLRNFSFFIIAIKADCAGKLRSPDLAFQGKRVRMRRASIAAANAQA